MSNKATSNKLSVKELIQHKHVLGVAKHNLEVVIDQIESMDHGRYDEVLEILDNAKSALEKVHGQTS